MAGEGWAKSQSAATQGFRHRDAGTNARIRIQGQDVASICTVRRPMHDRDTAQPTRCSHPGGGQHMSTARLECTQAQTVVRRLSAFRELSESAVTALEKAVGERIVRAGAGQDLVSEGEQLDRIRIVLAGWLSRYKTLEDGRRQIVNFVLPGETCDAHAY